MGMESRGGIVCRQQIVFGGLDKVCEGKRLGDLCVDNRLY